MAHYSCNPFNAVCPDFASDTFAARRHSIAHRGLSESEIIEFMRGTWADANAADKQAWARAAQNATVPVEDKEAAALRIAVAERKERKGAPFAWPLFIPTTFPQFPSNAAMAALRRGEHVPLWHFSSAGLESARSNRDENSVEFPSARQSVPPDAKLSKADFRHASERLLQMMELTHWPQKVIDMFYLFFDDVNKHPYQDSYSIDRDEYDPSWKALMRHADEARQLWHMRTRSALAPGPKLHPIGLDEGDLSRLRTTLMSHENMRNLEDWADDFRKRALVEFDSDEAGMSSQPAPHTHRRVRNRRNNRR